MTSLVKQYGGRVGRTRESLRRAVLRRRRPLAALCAGVAVVAAISAASDPAPITVPVTVAARDLPAGTTLEDADVTTAAFAPGSEPAGLPDATAGRVLAAPVSAGEPVTEVRLVGPGLADGHPGLSAVPLRLPDPGMVGLLRVGDLVDLVAADPQGRGATMIAADVPVLAIPAADDTQTGAGLPGRLVVVGLTPSEVTDVAQAALASFVTFTWSSR